MKKQLTLLQSLPAIFFLTLAFVIQAPVMADDPIEVSIGDYEACPGETLTIEVTTATGFDNISTMQMEILMPQEQVQFLEIYNVHPVLLAGFFGDNYTGSQLNVSYFSFSQSAPVLPGDVLFEVDLVLLEGVVDLAFTDNSYFSIYPDQVPSTFNDGSITPVVQIINHPEGMVADPGSTVTFEVTALPADPPTTFQWQRDTGDGWHDLDDNTHYSGTETANLEKSDVEEEDHGNSYRVIVERDGCEAISDAALLQIADQPDIFRLRLHADPEEGGEVTGGGNYQEGEEVELSAASAIGYSFSEWAENDQVISDDPTFTFTMPDRNVTLTAHFQAMFHQITAVAGVGGDIDPEGTIIVDHGDNKTFTITPDSENGFEVFDIVVNGNSMGPDDAFTFFNVTSDQLIEAEFALKSFLINATAAEGGSISPAGDVEVVWGDNMTFDITPDQGYEIQDVVVNGESQGSIASYTFEDVQEDHSIAAEFALLEYTVTASSNDGGEIDPEGVITVTHGEDLHFDILPDEADGYEIQDVLVDGQSIGAVASHTFENIAIDHTIEAVFGLREYTINAISNEGGNLDPEGDITVTHGDDITFAVSPDTEEGYEIDDVLVDGLSQGSIISYTFENVTENHTIEAQFALREYAITASAGQGGDIDPEGTISVAHGDDITFTVSPDADEGYEIEDVLVDDNSQKHMVLYQRNGI